MSRDPSTDGPDLLPEQSVIGSMLLAGDAGHHGVIADVAATLVPGDYYSGRHAHIHRAIHDCYADGEPVDVVTVGVELGDRLERCGGYAYLMELLQIVPHPAHATYYARIVRRRAIDRRRRESLRAAQATLDDPTASDEDRDAAWDRIRHAGDERPSSGPVALASILDEIDPRTRPPRHTLDIGDGWDGIDLAPGEVNVIGGQPGAGKTLLVNQWGIDATIHDPMVTALIANVEMPPSDLMDRQIARLGDVPYHCVRDRPAMLDRIHGGHIEHALGLLRGIGERLCFAREPHILESVIADVSRVRPSIVILDYAQRIRPRSGADTPRDAVDAVMGAARRMAMDGACVIVLSAVGRAPGGGYRTGLAAYRESGDLEYSADVAYTLDPADDDDADGMRPVILRRVKCRHGRLGEWSLRLAGTYQRMTVAQPDLATVGEEVAA